MGNNVACKKLEEFDKENPNYKILVEAIEDGTIKLIESECLALIMPPPLHLKFGYGMKAYLGTQEYAAYIAWSPES
jgi:hypothetical protein